MDPVCQILSAVLQWLLHTRTHARASRILKYSLLMCCAELGEPFKIVTVKSFF